MIPQDEMRWKKVQVQRQGKCQKKMNRKYYSTDCKAKNI